MENQYQKVLVVSYVLIASLIGYLLLSAMMKISNIYDIESKIKSIEIIIRLASVVVGAVIFIVLYKHPKVNSFSTEVASELITKVSWPEKKETLVSTGVVLITVLIAGFMLGFLDWLWVMIIKALI